MQSLKSITAHSGQSCTKHISTKRNALRCIGLLTPLHVQCTSPRSVFCRAAAAPREGDASRDPPAAIPPEWEAWALEQLEQDRQQGLAEYQALKQVILRRLQRLSAFLALYLLVVASGEVAACSIVGSAGGYAYLRWLMWDVDRVKGTDPAPMVEVESMRPSPAKTLRRVLVGYRYALQPRLVVPVALAAGQWYYNTQLSGQLGLPPLTLADQCGLLAGFLTCKAVFWVQVYEENKPKFDPEEVRRAKRPTLVDVEDVSEDLRDMLKKKTASDKDVGGQEGGDAKPAA